MRSVNIIPQPVKNVYHWLMGVAAVTITLYPARNLTVIGVTGTDGKTTTATLIYHLLKTAGYRVGLISTVGAFIGDKQLDTGFHVTTPNSYKLQKLLKQMKFQGLTHIVLEATSHGLDQHRLLGTQISMAVVTNVTPEHLDYHHNFDRYLKAKAKIFKSAKSVFLNGDDPAYPKLKACLKPKTHLIVYSRTKLGPFKNTVCNIFPQGYNQENAAAAVSVLRALKVKKSLIQVGLKSFPPVTGRLQEIPNRSKLRVVVDFAHTPNALQNALTALKAVTTGRLIAVYGAAGERDQEKRPTMGAIGAQLADEVILTAEDPRSEPVAVILNQMLQGVNQNYGHVHTIADRQTAINFAIQLARPGDTVALLGKGHEQSQNLDGLHELPWSDFSAAKTALGLKTV